MPRLSVVELNVAANADLGELYYTHDSSIGPGSVVSIDPALNAGVKKTGMAYDPTMLGVISTQPSVVMGGAAPGDKPQQGRQVILALAGRVPVKVTGENGPIAMGDPLTSSSTPGMAMKAVAGGKILGYALAPFDGKGVGSVLAFLQAGYYPGENPAHDTAKTQSQIQALTNRVQKLEDMLSKALDMMKGK
jgi:hypothetical protein